MKNLKLKRVEISDNTLLFDGRKHIEMYVFVDEKLESDSEKIAGVIENFDSFILAFQVWNMLDEETDDELNFNESLIENILSDMRFDKKEISNPELCQKIEGCILKLYENGDIVQINNILLYLDDFDGKDYDNNLSFYDKHKILKEVYALDIYLSYDIKDLDLNDFNYDQILEIYEGLKNDIDIKIYADLKYNWKDMEIIRETLQEYNIDISKYVGVGFTYSEIDEIREGLISGIDVSAYADFHLNSNEMREIREKLENEKWENRKSKN